MSEAEQVVEEKPDYRTEQQRLNALARSVGRSRLIASSTQIRNDGLELRRTPKGTVLVQVRKPRP